jgi:hypothetical protein
VTFTLATAAWPFAIQVTDRLLTQPKTGAPFDRDANKNIIFHGRDGVAAIAYSGIAWIDDMPTDQWIVETITLEEWGRGEQRGSMSGGRPKRWPKLGHAMRLIAEAFDEQCRRFPNTVGAGAFEVLAVGYQATHSRSTWFRPISLSYQREAAARSGVLSSGERWFRHPSGLIGSCPAAHLRLVDLAALGAETRITEKTEEVTTAFVKAVQLAGTQSNTIGGDCISIEIDCPAKRKPEVRLRFTPRPDRPEADPRRTPVKSTALSFSPWIIGPEMSSSPKVFSVEGWLCHPLGRYEVKMRGTDVTVPVFKDGVGFETVLYVGDHKQRPPQGPAEPPRPDMMDIILRELKKAGPPKS